MALTLSVCAKAYWDCLVEMSPQGNVFCLTPILDALGEEYELLLVTDGKDPQLGAVVLKDHGQPIQAPYPYTVYQGVLLSDEVDGLPVHRRVSQVLEAVSFLLSELEQRFETISFCLHHRFEDLRGFQWFHYHEPDRGRFKVDLRYTGLINLSQASDFGQYLRAIRRSRRRDYQKAVSGGLVVDAATDVEVLDCLHHKTFVRQGIERDPRHVHLMRSIAVAAIEHRLGELLICRNSQRHPVGALLTLYDSKCAYALFAGNDPEARDSGSATFLLIDSIRRAKEDRGLQLIDLVGMNSPNRGDFKASLNAVPTPYFVVTWESCAWAR